MPKSKGNESGRFVVRRAQVRTMREGKAAAFERSILARIEETFADQVETLGRGATLEAIRYGLQRAPRYGVAGARDLTKYVIMMFAFGRDFDTDERLPWAERVLHDDEPRGHSTKMDRLQNLAPRHIEHAFGLSAQRRTDRDGES